MGGLLSQAVANLVAAEQQIGTLAGLPPSAQNIQTESASLIAPVISQIQSLQQAVGAYLQSAIPELSAIETMVSGNQSLPEIQMAMSEVQKQTADLKTDVDAVSDQINAAASQVFGYFGQLAAIESQLNTQMTTLQGQLGNAQSEESAAKKKYYYLIALGPFGLIGLAVALGLYQKWQSDVNDYERQISALNAQISSFNAMKSACQQLGSDLQGVVTKISGVRNSVDFLASDILNINTDLGSGSPLALLGMMVNAATTEVNTLGVDAS